MRENENRTVFRPVSWCAASLAFTVCLVGQPQTGTPVPRGVRPLALSQTQYRLRAGERTAIVAPQETLDFIRDAKTRTMTINGTPGRGFVVGQSVRGDQILLAASLTMKPGDYTVTLSATSATGEIRGAAVDVILNPMQPIPNGWPVPPVILLNGWQIPQNLSELVSAGTCPVSQASDTFGSLESQLMTGQSVPVYSAFLPTINGAGVPAVYFFDNCVEDTNGLIESLGSVLGQVLDLIKYENGTLVPQVDLIGHSMGGLIVRAYLSGLQTNGVPWPPANPRVRKFIEIATPNFGSFLAADYSDLILLAGTQTQTAELIPGSPFLWNLATWNQRGDDLRGTDALAIIGDAGYWNSTTNADLSDGVVSITSGSLGFASVSSARSPSRTRMVPYCHVPPGSPIDCTGPGIANVDQAPETGEIILSFLENTTLWESVGTSNQTEYGGLYFTLENAAGTQYTALEGVSLGSQQFQAGESVNVYYDEFANGAYTLEATPTAGQAMPCGSYSVPLGYYSAVRCKYSPSIYSVQSASSTGLPGVTVASGSITITGVGFSSSGVSSVFANGTPLSSQTVSDQDITAVLPSSYGGVVVLAVSNSGGEDAINIFVAPPGSPPTISISRPQLQFSYTQGGAAPTAQTVAVSNSGGGTLASYTFASAAWLSVSAVSGGFAVSVNPSGLSTGTYTSTISVSASGATNSPQTISVTMTVTAPTPVSPSIALSPTQASFAYTAGGLTPVPRSISISNAGGGTLSWSASSNASWLTATPSGTAPSTLTLSVNPAGLNPNTYNGAVAVTAAGASNSPQTISVTLTVSAPAPTVIVTSVANAASGAPGAIAPGEMVAIKGSGLGPAAGVSFSVDPVTGIVDTTLAGTRVFFGANAAAITYTSAGQINAIVPYEVAGQSQITMQVQYQGASSLAVLLQIASAAPGVFTFNGTGTGQAISANQDYSFNGASNPAAPGSFVTLYFTGGGQTNPAGVDASVTGSVLKWLTQPVTVTVGGVAATVAFDGAAPTFVDGVGQLNIQLANNTPSGTQPLVVTVGGIPSPATATLSVQ